MNISTTFPTLKPSVAPTFSSTLRIKHHHQSYDAYYYYPREGNSTLSTSVTIRVTPEHYYLISWACLWALFVLAVAFGAYQSHKEHQWLMTARKNTASTSDDLEQPTSVAGISSARRGGNGRIVFVGGTRVAATGAIGGPGHGGARGDGEAVSSGDLSRTMVRFSCQDVSIVLSGLA